MTEKAAENRLRPPRCPHWFAHNSELMYVCRGSKQTELPAQSDLAARLRPDINSDKHKGLLNFYPDTAERETSRLEAAGNCIQERRLVRQPAVLCLHVMRSLSPSITHFRPRGPSSQPVAHDRVLKTELPHSSGDLQRAFTPSLSSGRPLF